MTVVPAAGGTYSLAKPPTAHQFYYTPTVDGNVTFRTSGDATYDTYIELYKNDAALTFVADHDDTSTTDKHANLVVNLTANIEYTFFVHLLSPAEGSYSLVVEGGGTVTEPDSTNTDKYQGININTMPFSPRQVQEAKYKLTDAGDLYWNFFVRVNPGSADGTQLPQRANGTSTITRTGDCTFTVWQRPATFIATFAEYDAIYASTPAFGPGATSVTITTPIDETGWIVKVSVPAGGSGTITFTGPEFVAGDERIVYYSDWHESARYTSTDLNDPFYNTDGYVLTPIGTLDKSSPAAMHTSWKTTREISRDYNNELNSYDKITAPGPGGNLLQYSYAENQPLTRFWYEEQAGTHFCSRPPLDWWEANKNSAAVKDRVKPHPLENPNTPFAWAKPLPVDGTDIPEPWVSAEGGWRVEWDETTIDMVDLVRLKIIEESYVLKTTTHEQVHYFRLISSGGTAKIDSTNPTHGEQNAYSYREEHPGAQFLVGRVTTFQGTWGEIDNTHVSFAPNIHDEYLDFIWPPDMLIGQSIGWNMTYAYDTDTWYRMARYRYVRLYIGPGKTGGYWPAHPQVEDPEWRVPRHPIALDPATTPKQTKTFIPSYPVDDVYSTKFPTNNGAVVPAKVV